MTKKYTYLIEYVWGYKGIADADNGDFGPINATLQGSETIAVTKEDDDSNRDFRDKYRQEIFRFQIWLAEQMKECLAPQCPDTIQYMDIAKSSEKVCRYGGVPGQFHVFTVVQWFVDEVESESESSVMNKSISIGQREWNTLKGLFNHQAVESEVGLASISSSSPVPSEKVLEITASILNSLSSWGQRCNTLMPSERGGVVIAFTKNGRYADIHLLNSLRFTHRRTTPGGVDENVSSSPIKTDYSNVLSVIEQHLVFLGGASPHGYLRV